VEDRYQAFKAKRIAPRLRLNWVAPKNSMRLALYFPTLEKMFLRGKDFMANEAWVNAFVDLHRCATYIIELSKIHHAWQQPQYRKETRRMINVLVAGSVDRCEQCVRQIKREIQMSMQAEQARAAQADAALERAKQEEAARQAKIMAEMMREEERRARQAGDAGRASIAAQVAEAAEAHVVAGEAGAVGAGGDAAGGGGGGGGVPIYNPATVVAATTTLAKPALNVGDVAVYTNKGVRLTGAKVVAVHRDGGNGEEPYYTVRIESAGGVEKQTTREHLFMEGEQDANTAATAPPPYAASATTAGHKPPAAAAVATPSAPTIPVAPVMPKGPLYGAVPAPTHVPSRNLSTVQVQSPTAPTPPPPSTQIPSYSPRAPPPPTYASMPPAASSARIGQWAINSKCDILDKFISRYTKQQVQQWRRGQIMAISGHKVLVTFYNWSHEHDIWVNMRTEPGRLAPFGSKTAAAERAWSGRTLTFREKMQRRGLSVVTMRGDGNCLFRAVAHQVWGDPELHPMVRTMVCDFMLANRKEFAEVLGALVPGRNGFERYVAQMRRPCYQGQGEWGGDPEIRVMEEIFDRPFELWDVERGADEPANIHLEGSLPEDHRVAPIRVSYHGKNHYNSVKPLQGKFPLGELRTSNIRSFRKRTSKGAREFDSGYK
jgi:hypothetical protein